MNKTAYALILAACLAGCATTTHIIGKDTSPTIDFKDSAGVRHIVTGEIVKARTGNELDGYKRTDSLNVSIDGQPLLTAPLAQHFNGTGAGSFNGAPAIANCIGTPRSADWTDVRCEISIGGERIGALTF